MCRYITAVIPPNSDLTNMAPVLQQYGLAFTAINNRYVQSQVAPDQYLRATRAICDCDSFLGIDSAQDGESAAPGHDYSKDVAKFRKLGWSQSKIDRWLSEKENSSQLARENTKKNRDSELGHWRSFIQAFLSEKANVRLGLLIHEYQESLDSEQLHIKQVENILLSDNVEDRLAQMKFDVIYMFWSS